MLLLHGNWGHHSVSWELQTWPSIFQIVSLVNAADTFHIQLDEMTYTVLSHQSAAFLAWFSLADWLEWQMKTVLRWSSGFVWRYVRQHLIWFISFHYNVYVLLVHLETWCFLLAAVCQNVLGIHTYVSELHLMILSGIWCLLQLVILKVICCVLSQAVAERAATQGALCQTRPRQSVHFKGGTRSLDHQGTEVIEQSDSWQGRSDCSTEGWSH